MPDEVIVQVLASVPNLAIAIWALWWSFRRVERMIDIHDKLIERLVNRLTDEDTQEMQAISQDLHSPH